MNGSLTRLLSLYPAQARPLAPPVPLGNAGGLSGARLWRFDSGCGPLVVRAWPRDGPGPEAIRRIHGWVAELATLDFIPVPLVSLDRRSLIELDGDLWELAPWRPGTADTARPPGIARVRSGFAGLAAVHLRLRLESSRGPSPGLISRLAEAERLVAWERDRLESLARHSTPDPITASVLDWSSLARDGLPALVARLRLASARINGLQPVLRDARPEHFLFEGDRLTGLVDFGAMGVDSPAADLARLLNEGIGTERAARAAALDSYAAIRPIPDEEVGLIEIFAESAAWLGPARWARWSLVERRRFEDPDAVRKGLERTLGRLRERLS